MAKKGDMVRFDGTGISKIGAGTGNDKLLEAFIDLRLKKSLKHFSLMISLSVCVCSKRTKV